MMEDIYEKILWEGYGLRFRGASRTRTGLICRTDKGLRELKKPRGHQESLCLAFDVKEQLCKNGFTSVSRCYTALDGAPFYRRDGVLYSLEDPMPTETLAEDTPEAFFRGAEALGRLHAAGRGLSSQYARWDKERLPKLYAKRRGELAKIKRRNDRRGGYDPIDLLLLKYYAPYMAQAAEAQRLLQEGGYTQAVETAEQEGAFCHNAYKGENLRLNESGDIFVGGFDRCIAELPLADLAAYLRRYQKKTGGGREGVKRMLEAYGKSCPLSEKSLILLQGMLIYPEKFLRLVNEYYNKRRACVSPAMEERLAAAAKEEQSGCLLGDMVAGE